MPDQVVIAAWASAVGVGKSLRGDGLGVGDVGLGSMSATPPVVVRLGPHGRRVRPR